MSTRRTIHEPACDCPSPHTGDAEQFSIHADPAPLRDLLHGRVLDGTDGTGPHRWVRTALTHCPQGLATALERELREGQVLSLPVLQAYASTPVLRALLPPSGHDSRPRP